MKFPYEIVHSVHDAFRGLAGKMARITGKTDTYFRSHGYEPRSSNPNANGNHSTVAEYMAYCELMQAAERGAGAMLNHRVHSELELSFAEALGNTTQGEIHTDIISEGCDVQKWLASKDLHQASKGELSAFETECDEAIEAISAAKARARAVRRAKSISTVTRINGREAA